MKKTILLVLTTIAFVAASCSKPPFWEQPGNMRVMAHTQSIEQMSLVWEENDRFCIFDAKGKVVTASLEAPGKGIGTFYTYDWTEGAPAFASFPYHEGAVCDPADSLVSARLISVQEATEPDLCPEFASVGMPSGSGSVFKMVPVQNIMGMIKMQITGQTVSKVVVTSNNDEDAVAGTVMVDYKKLIKGQTGFWSPIEGKTVSSVTMTPAAGSKAAAEDGCFVPGCYYVSVLPGVYPQGLTVKMLDKEGNEVDKIAVPGEITVPLNSVFDVDDLMPDTITLDLDFTEKNPLGTFAKRAEQFPAPEGNSYTFTYGYDFKGEPHTKDFTFTLYKGKEGYLYNSDKFKDETVSVLHIVNPGSTVAKDQCCIKFPAVPYRYLKSVEITHRGKSGLRNFRLQEGYPTPGHYYTLQLQDGYTVDTNPEPLVASGTLTIPTGTSDTRQLNSTKRNTAYYMQFTINDEYFIDRIAVTYSKTLE